MRAATTMLVAALLGSAAGQSMKGEWGQQVLGCKCKGRKGSHGYCGFHFHWGSQEDKPWCRTQHSCGSSGLQGSWMTCDDKGVEHRRADDGKLYTAKGFKEFYNKEGKDKWTGAKDLIEKRIAKNNRAYTVFEFRDYYIDAVGEQGWVLEWTMAKPEQRKANDGQWYTWDQFIEHYGKDKTWSMWARRRQPPKSSERA